MLKTFSHALHSTEHFDLIRCKNFRTLSCLLQYESKIQSAGYVECVCIKRLDHKYRIAMLISKRRVREADSMERLLQNRNCKLIYFAYRLRFSFIVYSLTQLHLGCKPFLGFAFLLMNKECKHKL